MKCPLIINGAGGRMGATLVRLAQSDSELALAGVVVPSSRVQGLESLGCPFGKSLGEVLKTVKGAVVIDFTSPEASLDTVRLAAETGMAAVIGTTGFTPEQLDELRAAARQAPLFWASNMSVGINTLLAVLPELVKKLGPAYDLEIMEIHHNRKKDAPSGTALKLGECLAEARGWELREKACCCREGIIGERPREEIGLQTLRGGDVVGDHTIYFFGPGERIEVTHRAHSRDTLALGALRAAKWLHSQKPGKLYSMADMLMT
ncbi:4-hydroxy-tetrahydrodipicolinate reductase [Desulfocurvibacter africanus]|uniref:4-hydroxy-tetrahydrodipicolinate reductase n=1 Tax=Desulfocurvibacter africanus TaxID=873 RepID=UPI002FD8BF76